LIPRDEARLVEPAPPIGGLINVILNAPLCITGKRRNAHPSFEEEPGQCCQPDNERTPTTSNQLSDLNTRVTERVRDDLRLTIANCWTLPWDVSQFEIQNDRK
jgi:hypothetical protein